MRKEGEKRKIRMLITIMASLSPANLGRKLQEGPYKMTGRERKCTAAAAGTAIKMGEWRIEKMGKFLFC